jgi:dihydrodipicolinate synthase/N-acetylneuraminate lyase
MPCSTPSTLRQTRHVLTHGTFAAAVTPLRDGGLDEAAFEPYVRFLAGAGLDGLLALGTTGEGILFSVDERRRVAELFIESAESRLQVAVHCGAQTTADTLALCAHAREAGADAVAVIGPPYFKLDEAALLEHFAAAAEACAPLPFYLYEFERTSGYSFPLAVIEELRALAPNLAGLKVSDTPFDRFSPYLLEGLDVFVGPESLIFDGLAGGAAGIVSGLAAAFPELVVAARESREATEHAGDVRAVVERVPRHAALKRVLGLRGVPVREDVRAPLRRLTDEERAELDRLVPTWLESSSPAPAQ